MSKMTREQFCIFLDMMVCRIDILRYRMTHETHLLSQELYTNLVIAYFYEIIKAIRNFDSSEYEALGFSISEEDFKILGEYRHSIFHVPEDINLYVKRSNELHAYMRD